jgi:hypothetical protein
MSIVKLDNRLKSNLSILSKFPIKVISHSDSPYTGSAYLFSERSRSVKQLDLENDNSYFDDTDVNSGYFTLNNAFKQSLSSGTNQDFKDSILKYLDNVNNLQNSLNGKKFNITRFETPFVYDVNYVAYENIKRLYRHYRSKNSSMDFSFRNYNSINFLKTPEFPNDTCLLYLARAADFNNKNPYLPEGPFTFDFYINPRNSVESNQEYEAGTILFLSSSYSVSIVSGSSKDNFGRPDAFRIMLQLSSSVDVEPSDVDLNIENNLRTGQQSLIFVSSDNSLKKNHWHHISIRWGGERFNNFTGSIYIDSKHDSDFVINSGSISSSLEPNCLVVGCRYNGTNSGSNSLHRFFNSINSSTNGVINSAGVVSSPSNFQFTNKLNAEIHELKIYDKFRNLEDIKQSSIFGSSLGEKGLNFYLPPFFVKESPIRNVLVNPFDNKTSATTSHPFEVTQSMGLRSRYINIENWLRDFITGQYPLPFALTGSIQNRTVPENEINDILYRRNEIKARNLFILPNDNGKFFPNFELLSSGTFSTESGPEYWFHNDFNSRDLTRISLRNIIEPENQKRYNSVSENRGQLFDLDIRNSAINYFITNDSQTLALNATRYLNVLRNSQIPINNIKIPYLDIPGESIDSPGRAFISDNVNANLSYFESLNRRNIPTSVKNSSTSPNSPTEPYLTIPFLMGSYDSHELYFFNIPNLYYGDSIIEKSLVLIDPQISGTNGALGIRLADNNGSLYRADCLTPHAVWNDVGNVFYSEGLVAIKTPLMPNFGKNGFELSLSGSRDIHVYEVNIPAAAGVMDDSSNPTFKQLKPNNNPNEDAKRFTYITNVNLHDEDLNIVGKAVFSQPIKKRPNDGFMTRIKIDY